MHAEQRAYIKNINQTLNQLKNLGAQFKGKYAYTDYIYNKTGEQIDFNNYMMRIRVYDNKNKNNVETSVKKDILTVKHEFSTLERAQELIRNNHTLILFYKRNGHEFWHHDCKIRVENIQNLKPSIEISAYNQQMIDGLLDQLDVEEVIYDTVPTLIFKA